jgi:hypothetical protein
MKFWFKFSDGSIAYLNKSFFWNTRPIAIYTSQSLGFGEWETY